MERPLGFLSRRRRFTPMANRFGWRGLRGFPSNRHLGREKAAHAGGLGARLEIYRARLRPGRTGNDCAGADRCLVSLDRGRERRPGGLARTENLAGGLADYGWPRIL